jgi:hypothetical protein
MNQTKLSEHLSVGVASKLTMKTNDEPLCARDDAETEVELCISCLGPNTPGTTFCRHCGTPLTSYAATGPFESILAEGDLWRKAIGGPRGRPWIRYLAIGLLVLILLAILSGLILPR